MEETLASRILKGNDLKNSLEKISSGIPNRILKLEYYIQKKNHQEKLELVTYKIFSRSITHTIEIDLKKNLPNLII